MLQDFGSQVSSSNSSITAAGFGIGGVSDFLLMIRPNVGARAILLLYRVPKALVGSSSPAREAS
jgi:hypothetical protein